MTICLDGNLLVWNSKVSPEPPQPPLCHNNTFIAQMPSGYELWIVNSDRELVRNNKPLPLTDKIAGRFVKTAFLIILIGSKSSKMIV